MASGTEGIPIDASYEADGSSDTGSIFGDSSRMSLVESINNYRLENDRRYHTYRDGSYWAPHDEDALRLDVIAHHLWILTLKDKLFLAPLKNPRRVIDVGTGIGIWASDFADKFPEAEVIGTDLSPIQDVDPAPNLRFEVDDCCSEWIYPPDHFDFIHVRMLYGSVVDWPAFYKECYDHLAPGGYIEHSECNPDFYSDDGSVAEDDMFHACTVLAREAGQKFGKDLSQQENIKEMIIQAGFVDVVEELYKWPMGEWPVDQWLKDIGRWNALHWVEGLDTWLMRLLTQYLGWTPAQVRAWTTKMRAAINSRKHHAFQPVSVVYARKPL
ncbi:hypothetical protein MMC28_006122 [Mycoblastus sanguinarius]|nr:hypothetical protein [Mycoblastus sanguinarius]